MYFGKGVDVIQTIAELLVSKGLITQSGAFFKTPNGESLQGRKGLFQWVKNNKKIAKEMLGTFTDIYNEDYAKSQKDEILPENASADTASLEDTEE